MFLRQNLQRLLRFMGAAVCLLVTQPATQAEEPLLASSAELSGTHSALILYDGPVAKGDSLIVAREIANLLPHFGFNGEVQPMEAYTAGMADKFEAVFVCGLTKGPPLPPAMLNDLARLDRPICWMYQFLEQLTAIPGVTERLGFVHAGDDSGFNLVKYRGVDIPNSQPDLCRVKILDAAKVQVLATADSEDDSVPYAVRSGNFWYFACPVYAYKVDESVVFADLLHDMLGVHHERERLAMVRIEDVSAAKNPADLRRITDVLVAHHVPFQIALIPVFKDPANQIEMHLADQPEVVDALHYMVSQGGTVVMHGITHQLHGVSGDDFEFWDPLLNRPSADGSLAALRPKLQHGLDECFRVGLYPVAFETPHYAASLDHYRSLATVFSHCNERRMVGKEMTQQMFPFESKDLIGQAIIPENLGYVSTEEPDSEPIIKGAHVMTAMRDPIASFFFHPFMPPEYLDAILTAMQNDGYRFISAKEFAPHLALGDYAVSTTPRTVEITPLQPFLKTVTLDARGQPREQFQAVTPGQPVTIKLDPPAGGLVAVQSVANIPPAAPHYSWFDRMKIRMFGIDKNSLPASAARARQALIVGGSVPAYESALGVYGIPCKPYDPAVAIPKDAFVIVPLHSVLEKSATEHLATWVRAGGRVLLEGPSPLAEQLGFHFDGQSFTAREFQDLLMPDVPIRCVAPVTAQRFTPPPLNTPLVLDKTGEQTLAVSARIGEGTAIYLAAELDPETRLGYTRYPFLMQHLRQRFGLESPVTSDGVEFYFDPGFRDAAPLEKLVVSWKREGVRAVYAAAWHFWPKWSFDYDYFIRLCHQQGIAVYAWIELPEVSPKFWSEHPEWREKTVTGRDGEIGWRQFMNLANDDCRAAAFQFVDDLLAKHNWDGVNIAELSFDTKDGLKDPDGYIPMNAEVRARFQKQAGFDPMLLFDEQSSNYWKQNPGALALWTKFRTGLTHDWLAALLDRVKKHKIEVIVTALDSISDPTVIEKNGCNSLDVVALMDRYNFTLQVEDSAALWGASPDRYLKFGEAYRKLVHDPSRLMFDINVVQDRPEGKAPTALATGAELALTARAAATAGNGRVAIYSESTVLPEDRALLPFVMGSSARTAQNAKDVSISANRPVRYQYAAQREKKSWWSSLWHGSTYEPWPVPQVDGLPMPCGTKGRVLLGAGSHQLVIPDKVPKTDTTWIKDITMPFTKAQPTKMGFTMDYSAQRRSWVTVSREPSAVLVDGQVLPPTAIRLLDLDWIVELPAGEHQLEIQEATTAAAVVRQAGEGATSSIVWAGFRGLLLLIVLYSAVRVRRLWRRFARKPKSKEAETNHV